MDVFFESNMKCWDRLVEAHVASEFYGLDRFINGDCTIPDFEIEEIGDVSGKSILHLMCHFGMDTLSWARLGARVTGIDFSAKAVGKARYLAEELGIDAEFIESNIYQLKDNLTGEFDIVYTSAGVLAWLPDLKSWGEIIAHFLKPEGIFYIRDFHPVAGILDDEKAPDDPPCLRYPYFNPGKPFRFENSGSYADPEADFQTIDYEWFHSLGEIINSLINAGLRIESIQEFPFSTYKSHPFLAHGDDGYYRFDGIEGGIPLMFSILAKKIPG